MTLVLVALGAFLLGAGVVGWCAHHFLAVGFQLGRDDRALDPGETVGSLPAPRPVGEASGRHHKPQAADGPPPDEDMWRQDPVWPGDEDTQVIDPKEVTV